ncbi:conserved phage C-terminal domain-containing protein [Eubacterium multiforme]|uniref:Phage protein (TIGR02220 family) n=1 Tax=Eubacterium multiforme TaxID=83339 RepID=A0ABT9UWL4_9FIRM|nr:conserved phage C-terminal domain-containing protein [Eubacterium multiforme]MDQ0150700.1 putative phage protein (TIGR02220 family) [Eubacterium multiforme]
MKYTILGFQQEKLLEFGLDTNDALILSTIRDMYSSKSVEYKIINNDRFIWINQSYLLNQIPIIGVKRNLKRKLKQYEELGLIEKKMEYKKGELKGKFSYINLTNKFDVLTEYLPWDKMSQGLGQNVPRVGTKCPNKDSSIKDTSNIDINIYSRVIEYLNLKANTRYKFTTKKTQSLIKARIEEGFTEEDFKIVIDKKVSTWINTEMSQYLRPETLFGNKFEGYLNEKEGVSNGNRFSNNKQGNREYKKSVQGEERRPSSF